MSGSSVRDIKTRIRTMESTRKITRAMEMAASAKLRQAQLRLAASRPYFEVLSDTVSEIVCNSRGVASPYLSPRQGNRALFVVIAGDRGLDGGCSGNLLKLAAARMAGREAAVLPIGRKAVDHFRSRKIPILTDACAEAAAVSVGDCFGLGALLDRAYLSGEFDEVHVLWTNYVSALTQTSVVRQLLPLRRDPGKLPSQREILFEPDGEAVFASIVPQYLGGVLYGALCESRCAEQAARRTAMDSATTSAGELIDDLRLKYNRARQAAITAQLIDMIAGAEA